MKQLFIFALMWCVFSQPLHAKSGDSGRGEKEQSHSNSLLGAADAFHREREHWLKSRLKFSGKTSQSNHGSDGVVGVSSDNFIGQNDSLGLNYHDRVSQRDETDVSATSFRYQFPAGVNQLTVETGSSEFQQAVSSGDRRYTAGGESSVVGFGASRPLFSRLGLTFNGIASHVGRDSRTYEQGDLVSQNSYELSSFGIEAQGGYELWGDIHASTGILALSGREYSATEDDSQNELGWEEDFYKLAMTASVERDFYRWRWKIRGRYQFADEDLPVSEYLKVAGPSMMAGFNGQSLSAFEGGWLRFDTASPSWQMPFFDEVLSSLNFAVLHGWVPDTSLASDRYGKAAAGQVSLQLQGRAFTANVSVGRMIKASSITMSVPERPDVQLSLTMGI